MVPSSSLSNVANDKEASSISLADRAPSLSRSSATIRGDGPLGSGGGGCLVLSFGGRGRSSLRVNMPSLFLSRSPSASEALAISSGESAPSRLASSATNNGCGGGGRRTTGGFGSWALALTVAIKTNNKCRRFAFIICWVVSFLWVPLAGGTLPMEQLPCETGVWIHPQKCKICVNPVGAARRFLLINLQ